MKSTLLPETVTDPSPQLTQQIEQPPPRKNRRRVYMYYVFSVLFIATFLNGLDSTLFTGASTVIARELHLGINEIGLLASAFTIFLTITIIPVGFLADKVKRSHIMGACLAVWSLASTLTGVAANFFGLFLTRMFTGIGEAGYWPAGTSLVGDLFSEKQRVKVMSWLSLATLVGPIVGSVLGGVIAGLGHGTWRLAFLITGIPGLLLAVFAWRLREPARKRKTEQVAEVHSMALNITPSRTLLADLRSLLRMKALNCVIIYAVLTAFTAAALQVYFPTLLQQKDTFNLTSIQAASYAGIVLGPTALVGVIVGGYLSSWLRRRYQGANMLVCIVSAVLTLPLNLATLLVASSHNIGLFTAILVPSFFVNTLHIGPLAAAIIDVSPDKQRATAVAIFVFMQRLLGTALAPVVIGTLASLFDPSGLHFAHNVAGHDLVLALLTTCPLAFIAAIIVGIIGMRSWRATSIAS